MKLFGEYLVEKNVIRPDQLVGALVEQMKTLPSMAEIAFEKKMLNEHQLLAVFRKQFEKDSSFSEACKELGHWNEKMAEEINRYVNGLRVPLGQILVKQGALTIDSLTHALDEFLGAIKPEDLVRPAQSAPPKSLSSVDPQILAFTEVFTPEKANRILNLIESMSEPAGGSTHISDVIREVSQEIHMARGAAQFANLATTTGILAASDDLGVELGQKADSISKNPELIAKAKSVLKDSAALVRAISEGLIRGQSEAAILEGEAIKKMHDDLLARLEVTKFDISMSI